MNIKCLRCKGRGYCGRSVCPQYMKLNSIAKAKGRHNKTEFSSQSPAPFVGRFGYPQVNVGLLSPPENTNNSWLYDAPRHWANNNYNIPKVVDLRSSLLNSKYKTGVKNLKYIDRIQEVGLASKPVDMDFSLEDKPVFRVQSDSVSAPTGPDAKLKKTCITSNPKVDKRVDKVNSDTDLKATDAMNYLYNKGFDENFLSRILSVGTIGTKENRKLVPTRWSITATDDTLGKSITKEIADYKEINDYMAYFGEYLGNYYLIMLLPGLWGYELFETVTGSSEYMHDYETQGGRKYYAENCAGGYYTVRLAVLEKLKEMKRKATCIAIRVITGDYSVPLGVWVTREAARKALSNNPINFASKELMLNYAKLILNKKFGIKKDEIIGSSKLLSYKQNTLDKFC